MKNLDFVIVGAQKAGTTALSHFLSQHPDLSMSQPKEVHLFDSVAFSNTWSTEHINRYYANYFPTSSNDTLWGEATPIYMYYPEIVSHLHAYNKQMKLIVVLRDPADRAISQYWMERDRGTEHLPLLLALLAEPFRLWLDSNPWADGAAHRNNSYRARGLYARQLKRIYQYFPKSQVLVLSHQALQQDHAKSLIKVFEFLGVQPDVAIPQEQIFSRAARNTQTANASSGFSRMLLKLSYLLEYHRLRTLRRDSLKRCAVAFVQQNAKAL
ncbi:MAG: sulfotransferase domain-containing protein [Pseudomonadales bacterium]|nr:sulfotransferase domain-containing protein [Pseudomonadales bacterium]